MPMKCNAIVDSVQTAGRMKGARVGVIGVKRGESRTSLTSCSRPGHWILERRAAAGDLWCVMETMLVGGATWAPKCLWELGEEDDDDDGCGRWGRREKLRVRPQEEGPCERERERARTREMVEVNGSVIK